MIVNMYTHPFFRFTLFFFGLFLCSPLSPAHILCFILSSFNLINLETYAARPFKSEWKRRPRSGIVYSSSRPALKLSV